MTSPTRTRANALASWRPAARRLLALSLLSMWVVGAAPSEREPRVLVFDRFNRVYDGLTPEIQVAEDGSLAVSADVLEGAVEVVRHRVELYPLGDGTHHVHGTAEFFGHADVLAHVSLGGVGSSVRDSVLVPLQTRSLDARVRVVKTEHGYAVTLLDVPDVIHVQVRSRLAAQTVGWCRKLAFLPGASANCDVLNEFFSNAPVTLPRKGETIYFDRADLHASEEQAVDTYLSDTAN